MKNILLIAILLTGVLNAQEFNFNCDPFSQYVEMFFEDAGLTSEIENYRIDVSFENNLGNNVYAQAIVCGSPFWVNIEINERYWDSVFNTDLKKTFLMYHELGHAVLKLDHVCIEKEIMATAECGWLWNFPGTKYPITDLDEFNSAKERMFLGTNQVDYPCNTYKGSKTINN